MRNTTTGAFEVYDITDNTLGSFASMGRVGLAWSVAGIAADLPTGAPNNQLVQAMASFDPAGGTVDSSQPLGQTSPQPRSVTPLVAPVGQTPIA